MRLIGYILLITSFIEMYFGVFGAVLLLTILTGVAFLGADTYINKR